MFSNTNNKKMSSIRKAFQLKNELKNLNKNDFREK